MSRYLNSVAREDLLPGYLARMNRHGAPHTALLTLLGLGLIVPMVIFLLGLDPYTQLSSVMFGIGAIVATLIQALSSMAVVAFFLRDRSGPRNVWTQILIPSLAAVLLFAALVVELVGFQWITGFDAPWTATLPILVFVTLFGGLGYGFWLRKHRPELYGDLFAGDTAEKAATVRDTRIARKATVSPS